MTEQNCIFCQIISGKLQTNKVWEDESLLAIRDISPQAPTHLLILPKKHLIDITECKDPVLLGNIFQKAASLALQEGLKNGFRLIVNTGDDGGQTVSHLHVHIVGGRKMSWPPG